VKERLKTLAELPRLTRLFFVDPTNTELASSLPLGKVTKANAMAWLEAATISIETTKPADFTADHLEDFFRHTLAQELGIEKVGSFFMLLRTALTGQTATPGLFETITALGKNTTINRLRKAISFIQKQN
jgi:glutamyl-tRNA synthetase